MFFVLSEKWIAEVGANLYGVRKLPGFLGITQERCNIKSKNICYT